MNTSSLELLQSPAVIVLAAGHGAGDPGATSGPNKERDQAIIIVDAMADLLRERGVEVVIAPHGDDTDVTIPWVNERYGFGKAWVIEVHRDSAPGLSQDDASRRCGVYTGTGARSIAVGEFIRQSYLRHGAHPHSWNRLHTESGHGGLGWIRQTVPAAHLLELGFMEGKNDAAHLGFLARTAAAVVYEAFTGHPFQDAATKAGSEALAAQKTRGLPSKTKSKSTATDAAPSGGPAAGDLLRSLATAYRETDLAAVFSTLGAGVRPEDLAELKETTLAQWILESGWAGSRLAREALNFAGLKYRKELKDYATEYEYTDWQGETDPYCRFASMDKFIIGYWRFLQRDVYRGWTEHTGSSAEFISFLLKCGYTSSNVYQGHVLSLVPRAAALLA